MKNLACYGNYDGSNGQCIKCNDNDCQRIEDLKMKKVISDNSTEKVERFLCPYCQDEVGINDTECSECHRQLN